MLKIYGFGAISLPIVRNKYLLTKNILYFILYTHPILSLKLSFMSAKDRVNLNIFTVALFIVWQVTQCIYCTDCAMFLSAIKQRSFDFVF